MRLHLLAAPDGTPRAAILARADQKEREVALGLLPIGLHGGEVIVAGNGYAGREFQAAVAERHGALLLRPHRQDEPGKGPDLEPIRQGIESIFGRSKTDSRSNATTHEPCTASAPVSRANSSRSLLRSGSTTNSTAQTARYLLRRCWHRRLRRDDPAVACAHRERHRLARRLAAARRHGRLGAGRQRSGSARRRGAAADPARSGPVAGPQPGRAAGRLHALRSRLHRLHHLHRRLPQKRGRRRRRGRPVLGGARWRGRRRGVRMGAAARPAARRARPGGSDVRPHRRHCSPCCGGPPRRRSPPRCFSAARS
jgi:hypothetical protein